MNTLKTRTLQAGRWLAWTAVFALSYSQAPLFTSNQNQYFLKGLAHAGWGTLRRDWLVSRRDSTPVFSWFVEWSYRLIGHEEIYYVIYALLLGIYLFSLLGILEHIFPIKSNRQRQFTLALIVVLHSAFMRAVLSRVLGVDWVYLLEGGWAGQRVLGSVLQPSSIGVLILLSIRLFLDRRYFWAVVLLPLAATVHPTYLLSAGALTGGYLLVLLLEDRKWLPVIGLGALALALVSPIVYYATTVFLSKDPALYADTREILVNFRIPHHAVIEVWWNGSSWVQLVALLGGLWVLHRHAPRLFRVLLLPTLVILGGTATQYVIDNDSLALLFPWRLSTWVFPICTAALIGAAMHWASQRAALVTWLDKRWALAVGVLVLVSSAAFGMWAFNREVNERATVPERDVLEYVSTHASREDVYVVPIDWQNFRLETGVPVVTEFKSIPYYEFDVDQWHQRVSAVSKFYREWGTTRTCNLLDNPIIRFYKATHVVLPRGEYAAVCPGMVVAFVGESFVVYSLDGDR